jgi:hypothetical protein
MVEKDVGGIGNEVAYMSCSGGIITLTKCKVASSTELPSNRDKLTANYSALDISRKH